MSDILLIQPPIEDFYLTAKRTLPYGLASLAGALRREGFTVSILDSLATRKVKILDWPTDMDYLAPFYARVDTSPFALFHRFRHFGYSYAHIASLARDSGAFLVGISSLFSAYSASALKTAAAVKAVMPEAFIVLGGHHPTALPESVLEHPAVDYVIRGDGENSLPQLARALQSGQPIDAIAGLARRRPGRSLLVRPPAVIKDLDALPVPAFDLVDQDFYSRFGKSSVSLSATRGCPLRCTYCAVNADSHHGFRRRRVDSVMAELKAAGAGAGLGFVDFEDEHLSADRRWFADLLNAVRTQFQGRVPELRAMNGLFAPSLDSALLALMAAAGFRELNLALITTCSEQLRRYNRPDVRAAVDRVLHQAQRLRLSAVVYVIIAGPDQQPQTALEDLLYLAGRGALAGVSVFYPAPGSRDYQWCRQQGLLPHRFGLMRATALPLAHRTDRLQTVTLLRLGRILNFMKHLLDSGQKPPPPSRAVLSAASGGRDRTAAGKMLLAAFLADGVIRGIDQDGCIYEHLSDPDLTRGFLSGLKRTGLRGARSSGFWRF